MSKNSLLKDLNVSTVVRFLEMEKKKKGLRPDVVQKAKSWESSSDFDLPASASVSSATESCLFTPLDTTLIMAVLNSLPPKASGKECLRAIQNNKNCQEQQMTERYTQKQLIDKIKRIRRKAAREETKF
ncbi:Hypothetical predicted protein [Paramuricea clavata]|uniref:Uncharacterized protein n=1 Tax=Paramuricea clavata TaxID=317549 RepID=A0A6S7I6U5_PARCT|nr:Hypothetical predicted protein [Paramuricea clavata]